MKITLLGVVVVVAVAIVVVVLYAKANEAQRPGTDQPDGGNEQ
jgi:preprotein translocase subunit SecG